MDKAIQKMASQERIESRHTQFLEMTSRKKLAEKQHKEDAL